SVVYFCTGSDAVLPWFFPKQELHGWGRHGVVAAPALFYLIFPYQELWGSQVFSQSWSYVVPRLELTHSTLSKVTLIRSKYSVVVASKPESLPMMIQASPSGPVVNRKGASLPRSMRAYSNSSVPLT